MRESKRLRSFVITFLLILSLLLQNFLFLVNPVYAASSPWTQTDWVGGSGQTSWSDNTKYSSGSSVDNSTTAGQVTLTNAQQFSNTGFETDLTGWTASPDSLGTSLNAFWKLDEASGTRSDSVGSNNLTDNNTVTQGTGKVGNAAQFTAANSESLSITDNTALSTGDIDFTIAAWVYLDSVSSTRGIVDKRSADAAGSIDYSLRYNQLIDRFAFYVNGVDDTSKAVADNFGSPSISTWYFIVAWYTATDNTLHIQVNNGAENSAASTVTPPDTNGLFQIGKAALASSNFMDGRIDAVGFWKKTLSSSERTALYNSGSGGEYPFYTNTRDTSTTYSSSSGSSKVITVDATNFTQSVNVGNTNTYNLSAYAYTDGSAVTSSDVQLYANGSTVSTTYTSVGSGWYQLTGTVTGTASSVGYGAQVKAGKTVYLDSMSLNSYASSGTLTSSIFDTEFSGGAAWGTLTYTSSGSTVAVKARTSNDSGMSGATDFSSCSAITSVSDISSNSCVTDGHRYIQYQLSLSTSDTSSTPLFSDISTTFAAYDATAPSISLTALATDPNSDTTPTLSGSATDSLGTVSNVQFQMDATSGSWTACSADDGSFDEATETFTCTPSALSDGSHTMYVRAMDSNSNTTASDSESSDTFTIYATAPVKIDLDSPGDNSYTNSERPTFKWKATSGATAGLSKYVLEIDNPSAGSGQASGDFTIDDIPVSRTTDYETNKYLIHYENFSDSDSTNNYISVYTKSSSEWSTDSNSGQNDGKLREGRISWKVKARDSVGNETSSSRTLFVDRTSPSVEITQVNDTKYSSNGFTTNDKTPTIYGKITDSLVGDKTDNKVSAGPKSVEVKIEKKNNLGLYDLQTLATVNLNETYLTSDGSKITDNSQNKSDKYSTFGFTPSTELPLGNYRVIITGKDNADNSGSAGTFYLNIVTYEQVTTPEEKKIIEEEIKPLTPEQKEKIKQELEITKPVEEVPVSALEKVGNNISQTTSVIASKAWQSLTAVGNGIASSVNLLAMTIGDVFNDVGSRIAFAYNTVNSINAFVNDKTFQGLAFIRNAIGTGLNNTDQTIGSGLAYVGQGSNNIAEHAPGDTKNIL